MLVVQRTDVGVVDLGQETDLGRRHWVFLGQKKLQLENTICMNISSDCRPITEQTNALANGLPSGPWIVTSKYLKLSSCGAAVIPGAGSATSRSVSCASGLNARER